MSHNIIVEGGKSYRLPTAGKYCDRDIVITAEGGAEDLNAVLTEQEALIAELQATLKGKAAGGGTELINAILDGSVEELESDVTTIGQRALNYRKNLQNVSLPNVTSVGAYAFYESFRHDARPTIVFPALVSAGECSFYGSGVNVAILPKLEIVSSQMFNNSTVLEKVDLGAATQIKGASFINCSSLATLIIRTNSVCSLAYATVFNSTPMPKGTGYIYVPSALVDSYKAATNWSTYAAQIRAIEDYPEITGG